MESAIAIFLLILFAIFAINFGLGLIRLAFKLLTSPGALILAGVAGVIFIFGS